METTQPTLEKRVLVADDDEMIRALLDRFLTKHNYFVQVLTDGNEALDYLQKTEPSKHPKVILMDNDVGETRCVGLNALEKIKQIYNHDISVIMMSGSPCLPDGSSLEEAAKNKGAVGFVEKPFNLDMLLEKVNACYQETVEKRTSVYVAPAQASQETQAIPTPPASP